MLMLAWPNRLLDVAQTKHPTIYLRLMVSAIHWQHFAKYVSYSPLTSLDIFFHEVF